MWAGGYSARCQEWPVQCRSRWALQVDPSTARAGPFRLLLCVQPGVFVEVGGVTEGPPAKPTTQWLHSGVGANVNLEAVLAGVDFACQQGWLVGEGHRQEAYRKRYRCGVCGRARA